MTRTLTTVTRLGLMGLAIVALAAGTSSAGNAYRFSELKSMHVENNRNEKLGKIEDLIYNPQDGHILYAAIEMGGFLGIGEKLYAVPVSQLKSDDDSANHARRIVLNRDKKSLEHAPNFSPSEWPNLSDPNWSTAVDRFFATNPRAARSADTRASQMVGLNVENDRGEELGQIDDLVVDLGNANIRYAALSSGTTLGLGGKLFAVPFSTLRAQREKNSDSYHIVWNVDKQQLQQAPGFDKSHWPNVANNTWAQDVDAFYRDRQPQANQTAQHQASTDQAQTARASQKQDHGPNADRHGPQNAFRSGDLVGLEVQNAQGEKLGSLESLAIELHGGRIVYGIVGSGGVVGIGETMRAVPWQSLRVQYDAQQKKNHILLNVDKNRFDQAPHFDREHRPNFTDAKMSSDIETYYGIQQRQPATTIGPTYRTQDIVGIKVRNAKGNDLGKIEELVINTRGGKVRYAVLSFGGFLGVDTKFFALPWAQLQLHEDGQSHNLVAQVEVRKESLEKAPSFDKEHWPDFADPNWSRDVDQHDGASR